MTPTEQRMWDLLADDLPHGLEELYALLDDDLASLSAIQWHVSNLRAKVRPQGFDIVCTLSDANSKVAYHCVRLMASPYDGRR